MVKNCQFDSYDKSLKADLSIANAIVPMRSVDLPRFCNMRYSMSDINKPYSVAKRIAGAKSIG
jgi:hypothetical protein